MFEQYIIDDLKAKIEEVTGLPVTVVTYPNGDIGLENKYVAIASSKKDGTDLDAYDLGIQTEETDDFNLWEYEKIEQYIMLQDLMNALDNFDFKDMQSFWQERNKK